MSFSYTKSKNKSRESNKTSGKCGEIYLQWDAFINHMEDEHDEQLRSDHLLQQEIEEVDIDANNSKEPAQLLKELPRPSRIAVKSEFNLSTTDESFFHHDDLMTDNAHEKHSRHQNVDSFEIQVLNAAKLDRTDDSIDEQRTFDSIHSHSGTDSDPEATNTKQNFIFLQSNKLTPLNTNLSCFRGGEFLNLSQDNTIFDRSYVQQLPTIQAIKKIPELQAVFKIDTLENKHRTRVAKELINFVLNRQPDRKLFKADFLKLAESIVEIFPSEVTETYYVPYRTGHTARGKLFDAYNNARTRLSLLGLIRRREKSKPEEKSVKSESESGCEIESTEGIEESDLEILKSGQSEWSLILEKWRKTHYFRQRELRNQNLKPHEYIEKYKVLLHQNSYELIDIDFKISYPASKSIYEWKLYYRQLIAKADKLKDRSVRDILNYINESEEENSKLALSLMLIAYILPNSRQKTKLEVQECVISYCKDISEADEEKDQTKRLKLESQPKIFLIGDSNKIVSSAFVDICGTRLKFENPLKAVEVCFYCFMVMNMKYPKYAAHVWIFIQKLIFEVETPRDTVIPAINTLINDLRLNKVLS